MVRPALAALALAAATCCAPAPSQTVAGTKDWTAITTRPRQAPSTGPGLQRSWTGADGRPVTLAVAAPRLADRPTVTLRPAAGDNAPAITAALATLRAAGGGTLRLAPGDYSLDGGSPALRLDGLSDVLVEGTGARLVFAQWGIGLRISNAARLAIRGVSLGYARAAAVRARVRGKALVFADGDVPAGEATVYQVSDPRPGGRRLLLGRQGRALQPGGTLSGTPLDGFADGAAVQVKLTYYQGAAIQIRDDGDRPLSHDITLDHVTVRDSSGMGLAVELMGRGLAVVGSRFGSADGAGAIAYDALHVGAATGDILIENNDFAGSGDDAVNLSSPIFDAALDPGGRSATFGGKKARVYPGARLALFDAGLRFVGTAQVEDRAPRDAAGRMTARLAAPVAAAGVRYARNLDLLGQRYAVVGNRIADCVCHGVLVQNPDGLVRDNQFARLRFNAIRVVTSAMWMEGAGAQNVVIARNRIDTTGQDERRGVVWAAITAFGELAQDGAPQPPLAVTPLHAGLLIRDNQIAAVAQGCISVASASGVTLADNRCTGFARDVDHQRMLIERADVADGVRRLPAKTAYLARGDGIWIDPLSTANVRIAGAAR